MAYLKTSEYDSRQITCCDKELGSIEAGLSFDEDGDQHILRFHFLDNLVFAGSENSIYERTRTMYLCEANTGELIKELSLVLKQIKTKRKADERANIFALIKRYAKQWFWLANRPSSSEGV